jgi:hypothetical protein
MQHLLNIPTAKDESQVWLRECQIFRNQGWRDGIITHRISKGKKTEYVTYSMPNGRIFKVAVDMIAERKLNQLKVAKHDIIINN